MGPAQLQSRGAALPPIGAGHVARVTPTDQASRPLRTPEGVVDALPDDLVVVVHVPPWTSRHGPIRVVAPRHLSRPRCTPRPRAETGWGGTGRGVGCSRAPLPCVDQYVSSELAAVTISARSNGECGAAIGTSPPTAAIPAAALAR